MNELSRLRGSERYAVCDDEKRGREKQSDHIFFLYLAFLSLNGNLKIRTKILRSDPKEDPHDQRDELEPLTKWPFEEGKGAELPVLE